MWILFLLLLIAFEAIADIFSKEWSLSGTVTHWILAISSYIIANSFWLVAIRKGSGLARGATLFSIGSALIAILIGFIIYKEPISRVEQVGFGVGLLAIILLSWPEISG